MSNAISDVVDVLTGRLNHPEKRDLVGSKRDGGPLDAHSAAQRALTLYMDSPVEFVIAQAVLDERERCLRVVRDLAEAHNEAIRRRKHEVFWVEPFKAIADGIRGGK